MGRVALSSADRETFRAAIRDVATRRFATLGETGVTMRGIADDLGVSPMTPYRYVRDRDEIFAMVRAAASEAFCEAIERAFASEPDPVERVWAIGRAYVAFAIAHPDQYRVMFQVERAPTAATKLDRRSWAPLHAACAAAVASGEVAGDPDELAHLCWAAMHGLVTLHLAGKLRLGRSLDSLMTPMFHLVLNGTRATPPTTKPKRRPTR